MIEAKITGAEGVANSFKELADSIKSAGMKNALRMGAYPLWRKMVDNCPVGLRDAKGNSLESRNHPKGNLKRSIKILPGAGVTYPTFWVKPVKGRGDPDGWYAKFIEYGHFVREPGHKFGKKGKVRAREQGQFVKPKGFGFIRRTYDEMDDTVKRIISEEIMNQIEKYIKS